LQSREEYYKYKESGEKITPFIETMIKECIKTVVEDDVGVITFGCGGMLWVTDIVQKKLREQGYGVTVINPILTAIEIARALVTLKLTHSRISYPKVVHVEHIYKK